MFNAAQFLTGERERILRLRFASLRMTKGGKRLRPAGKNNLTYLAIRVTIQTLPRDGDFAGPAGACCYDHISDHNARRRTWRHWEGQRRRPALPGQTPANGGPAHVTPGSTALWDYISTFTGSVNSLRFFIFVVQSGYWINLVREYSSPNTASGIKPYGCKGFLQPFLTFRRKTQWH